MHFTLEELGLIDAPAEQEFDNLCSLACELLNVPAAHVSVADFANKRIFYKSQQGHPEALVEARELPMDLTYCQHVALTRAPVVVSDAREHPLLKGTPAQTEGQPLAYLGIPIEAPGRKVVGGLCMMQPDVRQWCPTEVDLASKLAGCASDLIRLRTAVLTSERLRSEQRDFTYALSHDLRSPANTVRMIIDEVSLEKSLLSPDLQDLLTIAEGTLDRMGVQIEDVLSYSRTLSGEVGMHPVNLNTILEHVLHDLQADIIKSKARIQSGPLPTVHGETTQLRALLQNLVSNALRYTRPGHPPVIRISSGRDAGDGHHLISVSDEGIGIPPEHHTRIFELFSRLQLRENYEGTGIGLALCRRVAENHLGSIAVSSDGETGTTFTLQLPERSA